MQRMLEHWSELHPCVGGRGRDGDDLGIAAEPDEGGLSKGAGPPIVSRVALELCQHPLMKHMRVPAEGHENVHIKQDAHDSEAFLRDES